MQRRRQTPLRSNLERIGNDIASRPDSCGSGLAELIPFRPPRIRMLSTSFKQLGFLGRRQLSTATTSTTGRLPWFVDPTPFVRQKAPHIVQNDPAPLPEGVPTAIKNLHAALKTSPHLDQSELLVREPIPTPPGPPLPETIPKGRRKRGRTYAGEGVAVSTVGGLWDWIVLAQVSLCTNYLPSSSNPSLFYR